ncbi:hypothetical protein [Aquimarina sp. MMG016]|uniref:hypothetical protein n=1 Tax=Aquimarina sp. MMG016 TaxID=2822690 RepID=UPI001B3A62FA|nr:hypothetical protein [Aquimarina sp. MMG016]MBQ4819355.1 hypothetical protein [Aquimarina sp. MMG016]
MRLLLITAILFSTYATANTSLTNPVNDKEKSKKERKTETEENTIKNRSFHSVKKWKMNIEYKNGDVISKTISVKEDSEVSAMDTAFAEAEKYLKKAKNIKSYHITPVANNSYVVLAGE